MKVVGAVLVVAFVLLLEQTEAVTVDFSRVCKPDHVSHGFRRDSWQPKAIHYCFPSNITNTRCRDFDARAGINCRRYGDNFHLQGGLDNQRARCCEKNGMTLIDCKIVKGQVFSHRNGYNIMYYERVLRQLISIKSEADVTLFEIELCNPDFVTPTTMAPLPLQFSIPKFLNIGNS